MAEAEDGFKLVVPKRRRGRGAGSRKHAAKAAESGAVAAWLSQPSLTFVVPCWASIRARGATISLCTHPSQRRPPELPRVGGTGVAAASRRGGVLDGAAVGHSPSGGARTGGWATALRRRRGREPQPEPLRCAAARRCCSLARRAPRILSARSLRSLPFCGTPYPTLPPMLLECPRSCDAGAADGPWHSERAGHGVRPGRGRRAARRHEGAGPLFPAALPARRLRASAAPALGPRPRGPRVPREQVRCNPPPPTPCQCAHLAWRCPAWRTTDCGQRTAAPPRLGWPPASSPPQSWASRTKSASPAWGGPTTPYTARSTTRGASPRRAAHAHLAVIATPLPALSRSRRRGWRRQRQCSFSPARSFRRRRTRSSSWGNEGDLSTYTLKLS